jgi:hypothetical protein
MIIEKHMYTQAELDENKKDNDTRNGSRVPEDCLPTHQCLVEFHRNGYDWVRRCYGNDEWTQCMQYCPFK